MINGPQPSGERLPKRRFDSPVVQSGKLRKGDELFMRDLKASLLEKSSIGPDLVLYTLAAAIISILVWAGFARVEEVTVGQGRIIASSREQIIQSLEGGILEELAVREGDIVEKGDVLLQIDAKRAGASYREQLSKVMGLKGSIARLRAEAFSTALAFPPEVHEFPAIVRDETQAYEARRRFLEEAVSAMRQGLALIEREIAISEPLVAKGLFPEIDLLRIKRQANDIRLQISERTNRYRAEANAELVKLETELAQSRENITAREDLMKRTTIKAPVRGTVKNIRVTTIGGVIPQGADIMEIVPLEDKLLVETKVRPSDVAFLRPGLPATVKISAYDYSIYGGMRGVVEHISPDTLREDRRAGGNEESYYRVMVRTDTANMTAAGKELPIIPGMTASVDIRTGEKTVLDYLLKPVMKSREAFRER